MIGRPPLKLEDDAEARRLGTLGFRGEGGVKSTMDDVAAALANGARKSIVLRLEKLDPGRDEGRCGSART